MCLKVFSVENSNNGNVKTISMNVIEHEGKIKEKKERKKFLKLLDDIKTGKVLILISSCYILLTLPHTIDQFSYVVVKGNKILLLLWLFYINLSRFFCEKAR